MQKRRIINSTAAPAAIGPYSQAVQVGSTVYLSGQIPLDPATGQLCSDEFPRQAERVFENLAAVAEAAGGSLADVVRLTVYLLDLGRFAELNEIMTRYFAAPFPARAAIGVAALPRGAAIEIDAIMVLDA
jgi:reactive intermediate/imine deaminase